MLDIGKVLSNWLVSSPNPVLMCVWPLFCWKPKFQLLIWGGWRIWRQAFFIIPSPSCRLPVPLTEHVATTTMFDNQDAILWFESLTFTAPNIWSHLNIKHFSRRLQIQSSLKVLILEQTLPSRSAPSQPIVVWFPVDCRLELCWFVSCCQTAKPISSPVRITVWVFFQSLESSATSE